MFNSSKRRKSIRFLLIFCSILCILHYLFNENIFNNNKSYLTDVNVILTAYDQAKTYEVNIENKYQFTAIVLHWNSLTRVQQIVQNYVKTQMFKEIIIWNNNPQISLAHNHILTNYSSSILIYIINSKENIMDQAKYRACASAQTLACFFSDDDWHSSHYTNSLIASFRSDPYLLHSTTNAVTYYNNLLWTFMDSHIDLHTGFSWIGCGSIFLREHAQKHLQLLSSQLSTHRELLGHGDVFFSLWLNDMPTQMIVDLKSVAVGSNETVRAFSSTENFNKYLAASGVLAIRKLEFSLRLNETQANLSFPRQSKRRLPYTTRSPSLNDDFIFFSNILPIDIEQMSFDIANDFDRATYKNLPSGSNFTHFEKYNTMKAVDRDNRTCWQPLGTVRKGHFFAVDLLRIQKQVTLGITIGHSFKLQKTLDIRVSFDGIFWISHKSLRTSSIDTIQLSSMNLFYLLIESNKFLPELQSFRYIAFNATDDFNETFQVCDVQILKIIN